MKGTGRKGDKKKIRRLREKKRKDIDPGRNAWPLRTAVYRKAEGWEE